MRRCMIHGLSLCLVSAGLIAALGACAKETPEERIARLRTEYEVTLNSFVMDQKPLEQEAPEGEGEMAEGAMEGDMEGAPDAGDEGGMEEEDILEPVELQQDVLLDILVKNTSDGTLPVLTLDVSQVDAYGADDPSQGREKAHYRIEIDTSRIVKGASEQILYRLEDVDYQDGDGWSVEVRHPVPPEDRSEYRELSAAEEG